MFERFKEKYLEKLRRKTITMNNEKGEQVYLSKGSIFSWIPIIGNKLSEYKQIYPAVDEETMKIKWINLFFGGYRNLFTLIIFLALAGMILYGFSGVFNYIELLKGQDCYKTYCEPLANIVSNLNFSNITIIN